MLYKLLLPHPSAAVLGTSGKKGKGRREMVEGKREIVEGRREKGERRKEK